MNIRTEIIWNRPPGILARDYEAALRDSWAELGDWWHATLLPLHFGPQATSRYGYQPRTPKYVQRKFRIYGHKNPLEFTGMLKRIATSSHITRSTAQGVKVNFGAGAKVLNFGAKTLHRNGRRYPPIREELVRVRPDEIERMKRFLAWRLQQNMRKRQSERMATKQAA